ncbi:ribbon-helix-helix domain-containing protein [Azospirillum sp. SYSU D00513]|uniref:ribbon-helix-helix domain-containing protein n=1 Tax=Azospirillum sp. SYSU D00513 TaxID=2812561 RepID=UPI001A9729E4
MPKRNRAASRLPSLSGISGLVCRNIFIGNHRTSIKLEASMWDMLEEIAESEGYGVDGLCFMIWKGYDEERRARGILEGSWDVTFTSAVRVFIAKYYRAAAVAGQST